MTLTFFVNRPLPIFIALSAMLSLAACEETLGIRGNGDLITETRSETNFHALELSIPGQVEVRTDSVFSIEITGEENLLPYLETDVDDGVLDIHFSRNVYGVDGLKIRITAPNWDGFDLSGSAHVQVKDAVSGEKLTIEVSGSGDIDLFEAVFQTSKINVSGSGKVALDGNADDLDCTVSGSGDVDALDFLVKTARANVSGSGNILLHVTESLDATVSGSGDIEYKGDPQVTKNVSGSGHVRKL